MKMPPGVYEDVEFDDYLSWEGVSNSRLSQFKLSPLHFKLNRAKEPTPAMELGTLFHCQVLEPAQFVARYAVTPAFHLDAENRTAQGSSSTSKSTRYVSEKMAQFAHENPGRELVSREWFDQSLEVVTRIASNVTARELLNGQGPVECSIVWDDDETGVRCKARLDKVSAGRLVDLKKTRELGKFKRAIGAYGYHRQMAHYRAGWASLTGEILTPWIIAIEGQAPFCCQAAPLHAQSLAAGIKERRELMQRLAECIASDTWPAPDNPESWEGFEVAVQGDLASWFEETLEETGAV